MSSITFTAAEVETIRPVPNFHRVRITVDVSTEQIKGLFSTLLMEAMDRGQAEAWLKEFAPELLQAAGV